MFKPESFTIQMDKEKNVLEWMHSSFGKPDQLRWKYFRDCGRLKIKIMDTEHALLFIISCSEYLMRY
jgi:hypothetical protein